MHNEIRVIKNFVNCDLYHPDNEKKGAAAYAPKGEKLLIHLSNFRPVKRPLDCIRIFAEVRKKVPARLLMVGDGPERGPAEHLARSLKVQRRRTLHRQAESRRTPDSPGPRAADAERDGILRTGRAGGHGLRRRAGRDARRRRSRADHPRRGRLSSKRSATSPPRPPASITLLTDDDLHYRMAKAGRWNAAERFCTDRIIPQYEKHYTDVLNAAL